MKHIVSFSGGKDSTAMTLKMLEDGWWVDEIIFADTGKDFPQMISHINKFDDYIQIEKKDKIIDEMVTYIATLDIEEDICEKTKNEHCDQMNFGEYEDCIKQYFERRVENG